MAGLIFSNSTSNSFLSSCLNVLANASGKVPSSSLRLIRKTLLSRRGNGSWNSSISLENRLASRILNGVAKVQPPVLATVDITERLVSNENRLGVSSLILFKCVATI